eukprot:m.96660 g.96660  ORF g.96660 m.96660 type:complete len:850 (+) comp12472_c0_seq1:59-2608(+)
MEYDKLVPDVLPVEEHVEPPESLFADFDRIIVPKLIDTSSDGNPDTVQIGPTLISLEEWNKGQFNTLGQRIQRDDSQQVESNEELISMFNIHSYGGSTLGSATGLLLSVVTFGAYRLGRRKIVEPGYFGCYRSSGRYFLVAPGIHFLTSTSSSWRDDIAIDDENNRRRPIGDKTILQVPENHIAGGFRIGRQEDDSQDQEFVLFSQGRHVLPESKYYQIEVKPLSEQLVRCGPITILYVKEGSLGGAFLKKQGVYQIFYPGPPYLLHDQNYEDISLVSRDSDIFTLGPYQFVSVKDGFVGGCYRKSDGQYQILSSGHSYQLHSKDFQTVQVVERKTQFKLGPFFFITVRSNWVAGAYRKVDGKFVVLPPGHTYKLNEEYWREPVQVKRNTHCVSLGPLTFLTCQSGTLNGAYKVSDGSFVEFDSEEKEYILHEKEYHGLVTIPKYTANLQKFGVFNVITIRDGHLGLFEREGIIEIKDPGFYKVPASVTVLEPIPVKVFQEINEHLRFRSKDGIDMDMSFTLTWNVVDANLVARFSGTFQDLRKFIIRRAQDALLRLCKGFKRGDLLPTEQDILQANDDEIDISDKKEITKKANEATRALYASLEETAKSLLETISTTSKLGVEVKTVQIDGFLLRDQGILNDLNQITKSQLATRAEKIQGQLAVARAEVEKLTRAKQAEADAQVSIKEAEAQSNVRKLNNQADIDARIAAAKADTEIKLQLATSDARASAESQKIRLEMETQKKVQDARAEAEAISLIAEAEFNKRTKENEAASHIPEQELQIQLARLQVEMLEKIGNSAWQYPDIYTGFLKSFSDKLRIGSMTAGEVLVKAAGKMDLDNNTTTSSTS